MRLFRQSSLLPIVLSACLAGCAGFTSSAGLAPADIAFNPMLKLPEKTASAPVAGGAAQRFSFGEQLSRQWWTLFKSDDLNRLISDALADNPSLTAAKARLQESSENLQALMGVKYFPQLNANYSLSRQRPSLASQGISEGKASAFNLHSAGVDVSYVFDVYGAGHWEVEALRARVDYEKFQVEAAYLTLTSNIVMTAVSEALLREEISAMNDILASQEKQLATLEKQFALGGVAKADVLAQKAQVEQVRAEMPGLTKALSQTRNQLAVLAGKTPDAVQVLPEFRLSSLVLPEQLPVSLSSDLTRRRPDIRASQELLRAASAAVGVATTDLYPKITLTGSYGASALTFGSLFSPEKTTWNVGAGILQPIFNGGSLRAKRRAAMAAYEGALANHKQVILVAFQNVADALKAIENDSLTLKAQSDAEVAARDSWEITMRQFQAGAVSYVMLLNAERQHQQARINLIKAEAARYMDTVALFQSLGGGWEAAEENSKQ